MSSNDDAEREDQALDALIVIALRQDRDGVPPPDLAGPEPALSPEDQAALDQLGPDLVRRLVRRVRQGRAAGPGKEAGKKDRRPKPHLAGSLHRGDEAELTEQARQEMERKVRELDEKERGDGLDAIPDREGR
jgi:hypothetical protein